MCITRNQILALNNIILHLNNMNSDEERDLYLQNEVEDVDLFLSTLKNINKSKLRKSKKQKDMESKARDFTKEMVIKIFEENTLEDIIAEYSKKELTDMYLAFYSSKPLSSYNKTRIAQSIYHYIYTMNRTEALLG